MSDVDILMDVIVSGAMLDDGAQPNIVSSRSNVLPRKGKTSKTKTINRWTDEEDRYLRDNLGRKPLGEIAEALGRSKNALKVHYTRKGYPTPTNAPGWISLHQASKLLGNDIHAVKGWFEHGIIPGRYAFTKNRDVVMISLSDLKFWATRSQHWPYFDVNKMAPGYLRRLVEKAQARWGDEWLTTRQVADLLGLKAAKAVLTDIQHGYLPAIQCPHIGGRDKATWSFWFVRKSDALNHHHPSRGETITQPWYTDRAKAFLRKLVAEGKNSGDAAKLMKQNQKYLSYRMNLLRKEMKKK